MISNSSITSDIKIIVNSNLTINSLIAGSLSGFLANFMTLIFLYIFNYLTLDLVSIYCCICLISLIVPGVLSTIIILFSNSMSNKDYFSVGSVIGNSSSSWFFVLIFLSFVDSFILSLISFLFGMWSTWVFPLFMPLKSDMQM